MSDERDQTALEAKADASSQAGSDDDDDDDDVGSPFDHPAFLPVLLWALSIWFGYDGWLNQDPEMLEHVTFNRYGFGVLVALGLYFTIQAVKEMRADPEESEGA
jgi:hypothetical protein